MLFSDPKWGQGCLALSLGVAGFTLLVAAMRHFSVSIPRPIGALIGFLIVLAIARFIVNQIFD